MDPVSLNKIKKCLIVSPVFNKVIHRYYSMQEIKSQPGTTVGLFFLNYMQICGISLLVMPTVLNFVKSQEEKLLSMTNKDVHILS